MNKLDDLRDELDTHSTANGMQSAIDSGAWSRHEGTPNPMASYSIRLPSEVLDEARSIAAERGTTAGAWLREVVEAAVARDRAGDAVVPLSVLLAAAEEYRYRTPC